MSVVTMPALKETLAADGRYARPFSAVKLRLCGFCDVLSSSFFIVRTLVSERRASDHQRIVVDVWRIGATLQCRCYFGVDSAPFFMVALCNRADHYIFAL